MYILTFKQKTEALEQSPSSLSKDAVWVPRIPLGVTIETKETFFATLLRKYHYLIVQCCQTSENYIKADGVSDCSC